MLPYFLFEHLNQFLCHLHQVATSSLLFFYPPVLIDWWPYCKMWHFCYTSGYTLKLFDILNNGSLSTINHNTRDTIYKFLLELISYTLVLLLTLKLVDLCFTQKPIKNLPLVKSHFPVFNNLHIIFPKAEKWTLSPCLVLERLSKRYGDVFQIKIGSKLIVIVNSYDAIRALWGGNNIKGNNSRPMTHSFHEILSKGVYTIGTTPMGENYRKSRRHISQKVLGEKRNKHYNIKIVNLAANEMIQRLINNIPNSEVLSDDMLKECQYFHLRVALCLTYGFHINYNDPEHVSLANTIIHVENEVTKVRSHVQNVQDYLLPPLRFIWGMFSNYKAKAQSLSDQREQYLDLLYEFAENKYNEYIEHGLCDEYLKESLMFDYFHNSKDLISKAQITSVCLTMVSAGLDNVPLNFKYGMSQMVRNAAMWETGYLELMGLFETKLDAYENCYKDNSSPYLNAIVHETLRMFTVLPMALPRQTTATVRYKNIAIPSGSILYMNCWAGNHDENHFADPMSFEPKRYLNSDGTLNEEKHLSFGVGCRMCLGSQLSNRELYILFSKFLIKFRPMDIQPDVPLNPLELNKYPESLAIEPMDFDILLKVRQ